MWCCKCNKELGDCICPDIVQRLESLRSSPFIHAPSIIDKPLAQIAARKAKARHHLPRCPNCGGKLDNHGAASRGDGDIFDELWCSNRETQCGPVYEWHATYCECGCGGGKLVNVYDPEFMPDDRGDGP
jgi:hypothetical protein